MVNSFDAPPNARLVISSEVAAVFASPVRISRLLNHLRGIGAAGKWPVALVFDRVHVHLEPRDSAIALTLAPLESSS